jgi:hypothetical protein
MPDQKLLTTVAEQLAAGTPEEQIYSTLVSQGWDSGDINGAIAIQKIEHSPFTRGRGISPSGGSGAMAHESNILFQFILIAILLVASPGAYGLFTAVVVPAIKGEPVAVQDSLQGYNLLKDVPGDTATLIPVAAGSPQRQSVSNPSPVVATTVGVAPGPLTSTPAPQPTPAPVHEAGGPTITFTADAASVPSGSTVTLSWSATDATTCNGNGFNTSSRIQGIAHVLVYSPSTYTITCLNANHLSIASVSVSTTAATPPSPSPGGSPAPGPGPGPIPAPIPGGGTYPVYPGCEAPATTFARDVYIDPVNGSDVGDGSAAKPFLTFINALNAKKLKAGDHVILLPGDHGAVITSRYTNAAMAAAPVWTWIDFRPGAFVHNMDIRDMSRWLVTKAEVTPAGGEKKLLVEFSGDLGAQSNIIFADGFIYNAKDSSGWDANTWINTDDGYITRSIICSSIVRTRILNTRFALGMNTDGVSPDPTQNPVKGLMQDNIVKNFSGDGIRPIGSYILVKNNYVADEYVNAADGDQNHDDGLQSWALHGAVFTDLFIDHNWFQETTDPNRKWNADMQGISSFDGVIRNVQVTNNVVLASAYHGISWYGVKDSLIDHNTVINPNPSPGDHLLWIYVPDGKGGNPPSNVTISNNIAMSFPGVVVAGSTYQNNFTVKDPTVQFQTFNPNSNSYNLSPKPGSSIDGKGAGSSVTNPVALGPSTHHYALAPIQNDSEQQLAAVAATKTGYLGVAIDVTLVVILGFMAFFVIRRSRGIK